MRHFLYEHQAVVMNVFRLKLIGDRGKVSRELRTWGSSVHCLYTVAVAILAEILLEWLFYGRHHHIHSHHNHCCQFVLIACGLALLGFIADCRKFLLEIEMCENSAVSCPWEGKPY
jgi:hypothetical protein